MAGYDIGGAALPDVASAGTGRTGLPPAGYCECPEPVLDYDYDSACRRCGLAVLMTQSGEP